MLDHQRIAGLKRSICAVQRPVTISFKAPSSRLAAEDVRSNESSLSNHNSPESGRISRERQGEIAPFPVDSSVSSISSVQMPGDSQLNDIAEYGAVGGIQKKLPVKQVPCTWRQISGLVIQNRETEDREFDERDRISGDFHFHFPNARKPAIRCETGELDSMISGHDVPDFELSLRRNGTSPVFFLDHRVLGRIFALACCLDADAKGAEPRRRDHVGTADIPRARRDRRRPCDRNRDDECCDRDLPSPHGFSPCLLGPQPMTPERRRATREKMDSAHQLSVSRTSSVAQRG